jgi:hypothetical protein
MEFSFDDMVSTYDYYDFMCNEFERKSQDSSFKLNNSYYTEKIQYDENVKHFNYYKKLIERYKRIA